MSVLDKKELVELYGRRARNYDVTANLYYLIGFREFAYRRKAVDALGLKPGASVVEIGCGTGLNFSLLEGHIGRDGKLIGVDMSGDMLDMAKRRVVRNGWENVELVRADAAKYKFPANLDGIISTFAITLIPEFDDVIRGGSSSLAPGGRFVILDFRMPSTRIAMFAPVLADITRPFGVDLEMSGRHPWESLAGYLDNVGVVEYYGGFVYIATGSKGKR